MIASFVATNFLIFDQCQGNADEHTRREVHRASRPTLKGGRALHLAILLSPGDEFARLARRAGIECDTFSPFAPRGRSAWAREQQRIAEWVGRLPRPVGILTSYDSRGRQVLEVCRAAGVTVPDEVAVLGVDNDELLCSLSTPPLSSVAPNTHLAGYTAAETLDRMMRRKRAARPKHRIKPLWVATRQSTDVLAVDDREIAHAISFVRDHACENIGVEDVARAASLSRSTLKRRFRKAIGHSVHCEIVRVRVKRIKELLTGTGLSIELVAERTGFYHREYMGAVFKQQTGTTPAAYRKKTQNSRNLFSDFEANLNPSVSPSR